MKNLSYKYHKYIDGYIQACRSGKTIVGEDILKSFTLVERKLDNEDVYIDVDKIDEAVRVIEENFEIKLLDWQLFIIAIVHCYYKSIDRVVFDTFLILMGRGNGKNGFISPLSWYLTTHLHGIREYNVEIIANSEDQSETSFKDIYNMLERNWKKMKAGFSKTKTLITSLTTNSEIKYHTSNARTKDGKRSACLIFDEIHEYEDDKIINVFTGGFGKRKHSRTFFITTNGYVRGGVLDKELEKAEDILNNVGGIGDALSTLPLLYRMDNEEEVENESMWPKANPSLIYFPDLAHEVKKHWIEAQYSMSKKLDFFTKRMNLPKEDTYTVVAPWEQIEAASKKEIPYEKLKGKKCIGALDYSSTKDFTSVGLLFKQDGKRYWLEHTFVNKQALNIPSREIKFPVMEMVEKGLITIVDTPTIRPETIAGWFLEQSKKYHILTIVGDTYRMTHVSQVFEEKGLPIETVRSGPITHGKVAPTIESMFAEETIVWGDNPTMNWYTWNTYTSTDKKGNITYLKIEPKTRKTDGFSALVHAMSKDNELQDDTSQPFMSMGVFTY